MRLLSPGTVGESASDELSLLRRVARGEADCLRLVYERHGSRLMAVALRVLKNRAEAEEVVQEAFLEVWRRAGEYDPLRGTPLAWMLTICRTRSIDRLRSRGSQARLVTQADEIAPLGQSPLDAVDSREVQSRVGTAMAGLPTEQRRVLELAYFEGLSQSEIAERTGDALGTVKTRVRLGMEKLSAVLAELWGEGHRS